MRSLLWDISRDALSISPLSGIPEIVALLPTIVNSFSIIAVIDNGDTGVIITAVIDYEA